MGAFFLNADYLHYTDRPKIVGFGNALRSLRIWLTVLGWNRFSMSGYEADNSHSAGDFLKTVPGTLLFRGCRFSGHYSLPGQEHCENAMRSQQNIIKRTFSPLKNRNPKLLFQSVL